MENKICSKCKQEKILDDFYKVKKRYKNQKIFHTARCKRCTDKVNDKNKHKYRKYFIEYNKKHREKNKEKSKQHYIKKKEEWIKWISTIVNIKCKKCGYNKYFDALDFHHSDPSKKENILSVLIKLKMNEERKTKVIKELKKGYFLCSTCHREEHIMNSKKLNEIIK